MLIPEFNFNWFSASCHVVLQNLFGRSFGASIGIIYYIGAKKFPMEIHHTNVEYVNMHHILHILTVVMYLYANIKQKSKQNRKENGYWVSLTSNLHTQKKLEILYNEWIRKFVIFRQDL